MSLPDWTSHAHPPRVDSDDEEDPLMRVLPNARRPSQSTQRTTPRRSRTPQPSTPASRPPQPAPRSRTPQISRQLTRPSSTPQKPSQPTANSPSILIAKDGFAKDEYMSIDPIPPPLPPQTTPGQTITRGTPRTRGRPKGWKPGMRYSTMRGNPAPAQRPSAPSVIKRRGRPPKQPSPPPIAIYASLKPVFLDFLCEWAGCKAELHNLATLRRHVHAIHGRSSACHWGKCAGREGFLKGELAAHVEERHLVPMGWHVGDGPGNGGGVGRGDVEAEETWLYDARGNQVTPSVRGQQLEDHAAWKARRRKLAELIRRRDEALPSESESD